MTFKELEKILKKDGWYLYDTVGSHFQYKHKDKKGKITIPRHCKDIKKGTLYSILKLKLNGGSENEIGLSSTFL